MHARLRASLCAIGITAPLPSRFCACGKRCCVRAIPLASAASMPALVGEPVVGAVAMNAVGRLHGQACRSSYKARSATGSLAGDHGQLWGTLLPAAAPAGSALPYGRMVVWRDDVRYAQSDGNARCTLMEQRRQTNRSPLTPTSAQG